MAAQYQGNGFQWVSLSSSDPGHEQNESETEPCGETLPMELDELQSGSVPCGECFPANTPITPPAARKDIFLYILKKCSYLSVFDTVYVMVDMRNLRAHGTAQDGLPH